MQVEKILKKSLDGNRIEKAEAVELFAIKDSLLLANTATRLAKRKKPNNIVTYIVDRNVNYTNICITDCTFCAFYRKKTDPDSYVLPFDEICKKIEETLELGGHQILLQGGHNIDLHINYFITFLC